MNKDPECRPASLKLKPLAQNILAGKRLNRRGEYQSEPTSVLDIRSPSPTSTLSNSYGGFFPENGQLLESPAAAHLFSKDASANLWQLQEIAETPVNDAPVSQIHDAPETMGMEYLQNIFLDPATATAESSYPRNICNSHSNAFAESLPSLGFPGDVFGEISGQSLPTTAETSSSQLFLPSIDNALPASDFNQNLKYCSVQRQISDAQKPVYNVSLPLPQIADCSVQSQAESDWISAAQKRAPAEPQGALISQQFAESAKYIERGCLDYAKAILARLNHSLESPSGRPAHHRATFYFKEALAALLLQSKPTRNPSLRRIITKITACKNFSEISPIPHFMTVTSSQVFLEALEHAEKIHIIDLDFDFSGYGGQWASFLQEISCRTKPISVRLTAVVAHETLETNLIRQSLCGYAETLNVRLEFQTLEAEALAAGLLQLKEEESVAVNYSIEMQRSLLRKGMPQDSLLNLIKHFRPKTVVVAEKEQTEKLQSGGYSFSEELQECLGFYAHFFESLETLKTSADRIESVEKFILAVNIQNFVKAAVASYNYSYSTWKDAFIAAGFRPQSMSSFTEKQAEWLLRSPQKGYSAVGFYFQAVRNEQQQMFRIGWKDRTLATVSAWNMGLF
eukprot:TRINITY_DN446_c0_g2_i1.p1 TRINITY_DN446_c0_g2~~TRINITY_DN446_c0_g2_i1.p1  ORF type:complete len:624 (+),score=59.20 TRINITY_DN446_c0_g2_i1:249-2120(+)